MPDELKTTTPLNPPTWDAAQIASARRQIAALEQEIAEAQRWRAMLMGAVHWNEERNEAPNEQSR